ncbi:MAG TPA: FAD-dependent oxidoreductase, partial [Myxococcota bacterium]|nr:FAD-dependent oxidoreductase [Myxococcota bacterium]
MGGLSAAHELAERGFRVQVYERNPHFGGKARSIPVPGSGVGGRPDLPGEHGFRFFPGFYRHVTDTMARIPYPGNPRGVFDNLVTASRMLLARTGAAPVEVPLRFPHSTGDLFTGLESLMRFTFAVPPHETLFYLSRLSVLLSSSDERRVTEYEHLPWWEFNRAAQMSPQYQQFLGQGFTRSLVAIRAEEASTRTAGYIGLQLAMGLVGLGPGVDRLLNGPTSTVWIDPWVAYLRSLGVEFHANAPVQAI